LLPPADDQVAVPTSVGPIEMRDPGAVSARPGGLKLFWWLSVAVIVADQIAKAIVRATLPLYDSRPVISGFIDFVHVQNRGVAFGLLNELNLRYNWVFTTGLAALALAGIAYYARTSVPRSGSRAWACRSSSAARSAI
jgi:lipoprotein signal peptidase